MDKIYFFKSVMEKHRPRFKMLPNQMVDGKSVIPEWNVSGDQDIRNRYPIGTVFASLNVTEKAGYYEATPDNRVVESKLENHVYHKYTDEPTPEMREAYQEYLLK